MVWFITFDYHSNLDCDQATFNFHEYFKVIHYGLKTIEYCREVKKIPISKGKMAVIQ